MKRAPKGCRQPKRRGTHLGFNRSGGLRGLRVFGTRSASLPDSLLYMFACICPSRPVKICQDQPNRRKTAVFHFGPHTNQVVLLSKLFFDPPCASWAHSAEGSGRRPPCARACAASCAGVPATRRPGSATGAPPGCSRGAPRAPGGPTGCGCPGRSAAPHASDGSSSAILAAKTLSGPKKPAETQANSLLRHLKKRLFASPAGADPGGLDICNCRLSESLIT